MNMFQRTAAAESGVSADDMLVVVDTVDDSENLLAIPLSQEIPPDFTFIGYDKNMRRVEEILSQGGKRRNPLLYGNQGIGKTAITYGLVQRKNERDLSMNMYKRTFYRLNTSKLLHADDMVEINRRFDTVLASLAHYDVLVIENIYTLIIHLKGRGANGVLIGLLEALSRRKFQAFATCTTKEKAQLFIDVPEMHEYFVPEEVEEPANEELLAILRGVRRGYESRYGVKIPDETLRLIRDMTQKYHNGLEDWAQPMRAMIVLDRGIARFSVEMNSKPQSLNDLENEQECLANELQSLATSIQPHDQARCRALQERLAIIEPEIAKQRQAWDTLTEPIGKLHVEKATFEEKLRSYLRRQRTVRESVRTGQATLSKMTPADELAELDAAIKIANNQIARVNLALMKVNLSEHRDNCVAPDHMLATISMIVGVPLDRLTQSERERMLRLEADLGTQVFDQPEAMSALAKSVRVAKAGLGEDAPPHGTFLFLGPSGVGKTEAAKAAGLTVTDGNMVRLDMSEYMEKHSVSRLIGSPPGYQGNSEGGILTNAVMARPNSTLLFDEIEKAHEDIQLILLQVMDYGRLTDSRGVAVDFRDTYIILTTNIGGSHFLDRSISYEMACERAVEDLKSKVRPEVLGRIDGIIGFRRLEVPTLKRIAQRRINLLDQRLQFKHDLALKVDDACIEKFCVRYRDDLYGGRPILKALKRTLVDDVAMAVFARSEDRRGGSIRAHFEADSFALDFTA